MSLSDAHQSGIGPVFVINLDRQPKRWADMHRELAGVLDTAGNPLSERAIRYSACDAQAAGQQQLNGSDIEQFYTLADQLFVEPQPHALPDTFDLMRPITMSRAEVAIARSHINVWKTVAQSTAAYALILEDDVWFERGFARIIDQAWSEMSDADQTNPAFDILYVSYKEARHGAPKELISKNVFRPERGIWYLSGYVLSKKGAQALLDLLPCQGPIDLWINHKFKDIDVRALRRSVINQRLDTPSTNSYSVLPALSQLGVIDSSDASLFRQRPTHSPVFALGPPGSGLSSLAMALSMLGYRCCSDLDQIPEDEFERLIAGKTQRIFDAYVNVASLGPHLHVLVQRYPNAKFIVIDDLKGTGNHLTDGMLNALQGADLIRLHGENTSTWRALCEHVRLPPPVALYPSILDAGQRKLRRTEANDPVLPQAKRLRHDRSPWIIPHSEWSGINLSQSARLRPLTSRIIFEDDLANVQPERWLFRNDTFPGNLGLFRPANVATHPSGGLSFSVSQQQLGVRKLSAAAISSRCCFLYGRFEATLQATNVSGLVTGFFLHRDSPRQEIDIEITGNRPDRLLVNVFYNPGSEGAKFDYGYRGTPVAIPLGFDASKAPHQFAIEWDPGEIRWFVDGELVYRRAAWNPTPIPHLPMTLHLNTWPSRSRELAGRLSRRLLPAAAIVSKIAVNAAMYKSMNPTFISTSDALTTRLADQV